MDSHGVVAQQTQRTCLGSGALYSDRVLVANPSATSDSTVLVAAGNTVDDRDTDAFAEVLAQVSHSRAAQDQYVDVVLRDGARGTPG